MAAITDYATLVTAVGDYLARSDLSGFIPNFIQNSQGKLHRTLKIRAMEATLSGTIANGVLAVPTDYRQLKFANVNGNTLISLERTTPEYIYARYPARSGAADPKYIARVGDNFIFGPYPGDVDIIGTYYKRLPLLSASNTTNWFTENAADALLYGAVLEAQPFLMNDKRIPVWSELFTQSVNTIMDDDEEENHSGSNLSIKVG